MEVGIVPLGGLCGGDWPQVAPGCRYLAGAILSLFYNSSVTGCMWMAWNSLWVLTT